MNSRVPKTAGLALILLLAPSRAWPAPRSAPAAPPVSPKARQALAKKDPCYGWYYEMVSSTARTRRDVAVASSDGAPCRPMIEQYLTQLAPIPSRCSKIKLGEAPALLARELRESAARWNARGWEHWEVEFKNPVSRELEKARDFYQRTLRAGCDT